MPNKDFPPTVATVDERLHAAYDTLRSLDTQPPVADALTWVDVERVQAWKR